MIISNVRVFEDGTVSQPKNVIVRDGLIRAISDVSPDGDEAIIDGAAIPLCRASSIRIFI